MTEINENQKKTGIGEKDRANSIAGTSYDEEGYDKIGYNKCGFNRQGIHKITGTKRDKYGFDRNGICKRTNEKFDENLFNQDGIHRITGTKNNKNDFNRDGINKNTGEKYDTYGFDIRGIHKETNEKFDKCGFDIRGIHRNTNTERDELGFDRHGYNERNILTASSKLGFSRSGVDKDRKNPALSLEELTRYRETRERKKLQKEERLLFSVLPEIYNEKVQNFQKFFGVEDVQKAKSYKQDKKGLPMGVSGNNAVVYCFQNSQKFAVRCFYHLYESQKIKYQKLREFIDSNYCDFLIDFDFYEKGVLIDGIWRPITILPWIEGQMITNYLYRVLNDPMRIKHLTDNFIKVIEKLYIKKAAHGDLQHGNILIDGSGAIKLIDYDDFFLEDLADQLSPEVGHVNYQHPRRDKYDYDGYLDNFSEWSILISLKALQKKPELWKKLKGDDERLLFCERDYWDFENSEIYQEIMDIKDENLTALIRKFVEITKLDKVFEIPSVLFYVDSVTSPSATKTNFASNSIEKEEKKEGEKKGEKEEEVKETFQAENQRNTTVKPEMVQVKSGTFQMGHEFSGSTGEGCGPVHTVTLSYQYWIAKYQVTFEGYDTYCQETGKFLPNDCIWGRGLRPVIVVNWWDAVGYCNWLSLKEELKVAYDSDGNLIDSKRNITTDIKQVEGYRLPTNAEWEYAARGGQKLRAGYQFAGSDHLEEVAWYWQNSGDKMLPGTDTDWNHDKVTENHCKTHEVGRKKANELGLYDMSGNVLEMCHDWYSSSYYSRGSQVNPIGPATGSERVLRGGCYFHIAQNCCVAYHRGFDPIFRYSNIGFRVARTVS